MSHMSCCSFESQRPIQGLTRAEHYHQLHRSNHTYMSEGCKELVDRHLTAQFLVMHQEQDSRKTMADHAALP